MRRVVAITLALLSLQAVSQMRYNNSYSEPGVLLTAAAPTGAQEGWDAQAVTAYRWIVAAPSGQTITGGFMDCYYRPTVTGVWTPCVQASVTLRTGNRFAPSFDYELGVGIGRLRWVPRAITLSGAGTTVTVYTEVASR